MSSNLSYAKALLHENEYTCVLYDGEHTLTSMERGVKPLLIWLDGGEDMTPYSAADKVIGKGAAFLYVLLGIREIYTGVVSEGAREVLLSNGISLEYESCVEHIFNRNKTGFCPIESAVSEIKEPREALEVIRQTVRKLNS